MNLRYFKESEFNRNGVNWFDKMNPELLIRLDALRGVWGAPIYLSQHPRGIGRMDDSGSQHNYNKWGEVRAVDCFPSGSYLHREFYELAQEIGITGIGYYPNWKQGDLLRGGFHLDVRPEPAQWGFNGGMVSIDEVL
jgi:hypothetical protein